jgi:large subunit ribosomal protein L22
MSSAKSTTKYLRISPRKARLAADLIRGLPVAEAEFQLEHSGLKAGRLLTKTLNSAIASAETLYELRRENLIVAEVRVDAGPVFKRAKPKNKGGRHPIMKRTSHFVVVVKEA